MESSEIPVLLDKKDNDTLEFEESKDKSRDTVLILSQFLAENNIGIKTLHKELGLVAKEDGNENISYNTLYSYTRQDPRLPNVDTLFKLIFALRRIVKKEDTERDVTFDDILQSKIHHRYYKQERQIDKSIETFEQKFSGEKALYSLDQGDMDLRIKAKEKGKENLLAAIAETVNIGVKVRLLIKLSKLFFSWGDYNWTNSILDVAEPLARKAQDYREEIRITLMRVNVFKRIEIEPNIYAKCLAGLDYLRLQKNWSEEDFILEGYLIHSEGIIFRKIGLEKAAMYHSMALQVVDHIASQGADRLRAYTKMNQGILLQEKRGEIDNSILSHRESLAIFTKLKDEAGIAKTQLHLAHSLCTKAMSVQESAKEGLLREARKYISLCKKTFEKIGDRHGIATAYFIRGKLNSIASYRKNYDESISCLEKAYQAYEGDDGSRNKRGQFYSLLLKGKVLILKARNSHQKQKNRLNYLNQALSSLKQAENLLGKDFHDYKGRLCLYIYYCDYYLEKIKNNLQDNGNNSERNDKQKEYIDKARSYCNKVFEKSKPLAPLNTISDSENKEYFRVITKKYQHISQKDKYIGNALLNLSYIFLEEAKLFKEENKKKKAQDKLDEAYANLIPAITQFQKYDHQFYLGKCYMQRAAIIEKRSEVQNKDNRGWFKKQYNYYSLAHDCFTKIDRHDYMNRTEQQIQKLRNYF